MKPDDDDVQVRHWGVNSLPRGTVIGNTYEIVGELGSGGFGIVYEAKDRLNSEKLVAIKEYFPQSLCGRDSVSRAITPQKERDRKSYQKGIDAFLREAHMLRELTHPGIIRVHHAFKELGNVYFAMERLHGTPLQSRIDAGITPTEAEIKDWLQGILEALKVLHDAKLLHRDISPTNIVINDKNKPVLIDFGAARQAVGGESMLLTAIARQGYTPYEQYDEYGIEQQTNATDFYALGATFYHLMTGTLPVSCLRRKHDLPKDRLLPLSEQVAGRFSPALTRAIEKAMAVEPKDRWTDADAWLMALKQIPQQLAAAPKVRDGDSLLSRIVLAAGAIAVIAIVIAGALIMWADEPADMTLPAFEVAEPPIVDPSPSAPSIEAPAPDPDATQATIQNEGGEQPAGIDIFVPAPTPAPPEHAVENEPTDARSANPTTTTATEAITVPEK